MDSMVCSSPIRTELTPKRRWVLSLVRGWIDDQIRADLKAAKKRVSKTKK